MFDVLVYLYENYWRPDACPEHEQLTRKLSSVGFESEEIEDALTWLDGVAAAAEARVGVQQADSVRVYVPAELSARLLDLELAGRVARLPGQMFQRLERG